VLLLGFVELIKFELKSEEKTKVFEEIKLYLNPQGVTIIAYDFQRPWGCFFVIDEQICFSLGSNFFH
jgi:hypothetical protein